MSSGDGRRPGSLDRLARVGFERLPADSLSSVQQTPIIHLRFALGRPIFRSLWRCFYRSPHPLYSHPFHLSPFTWLLDAIPRMSTSSPEARLASPRLSSCSHSICSRRGYSSMVATQSQSALEVHLRSDMRGLGLTLSPVRSTQPDVTYVRPNLHVAVSLFLSPSPVAFACCPSIATASAKETHGRSPRTLSGIEASLVYGEERRRPSCGACQRICQVIEASSDMESMLLLVHP